jgi:hypothetical protein
MDGRGLAGLRFQPLLRRKLLKKKALLFMNKKQQKNFVNLGCAGFSGTGPASKKFLRRFFQKAASSFPGQETPWPVAAETA